MEQSQKQMDYARKQRTKKVAKEFLLALAFGYVLVIFVVVTYTAMTS